MDRTFEKTEQKVTRDLIWLVADHRPTDDELL